MIIWTYNKVEKSLEKFELRRFEGLLTVALDFHFESI